MEVADIQTINTEAPLPEQFLQTLEDASSHSDTTSMSSEDELAIESEIMRGHDSEEEIDHGPVLANLRAERK